MVRTRGIANFVVRYNSDPMLVTDNHKSAILFLTDTDERNFDEQGEAIVFLMECTSPITKLDELVPELKNCKKFKYDLPESHIRPKHQLMSSMDLFIEE